MMKKYVWAKKFVGLLVLLLMAGCSDGIQQALEDIEAGSVNIEKFPEPGSSDVSVDTEVHATFSDSVDPESLSEAAFVLEQVSASGANPVAGQVAVAEVDGKVRVIFTANEPLSAESQYQVKIMAEVVQLSSVVGEVGSHEWDAATPGVDQMASGATGQVVSNSLNSRTGSDVVWSFTTAAQVDSNDYNEAPSFPSGEEDPAETGAGSDTGDGSGDTAVGDDSGNADAGSVDASAGDTAAGDDSGSADAGSVDASAGDDAGTGDPVASAVSYDGIRFAFQSNRNFSSADTQVSPAIYFSSTSQLKAEGGLKHLKKMNINAAIEGVTPFTSRNQIANIQFSPDNQRLAFTTYEPLRLGQLKPIVSVYSTSFELAQDIPSVARVQTYERKTGDPRPVILWLPDNNLAYVKISRPLSVVNGTLATPAISSIYYADAARQQSSLLQGMGHVDFQSLTVSRTASVNRFFYPEAKKRYNPDGSFDNAPRSIRATDYRQSRAVATLSPESYDGLYQNYEKIDVNVTADGTRLAFIMRDLDVNSPKQYRLFICKLSASGICEGDLLEPLKGTYLASAEVRSPCWAEDGKHLLFDAEVANNRDIYMVHLENFEVTRLTTHPGIDATPACYNGAVTAGGDNNGASDSTGGTDSGSDTAGGTGTSGGADNGGTAGGISAGGSTGAAATAGGTDSGSDTAGGEPMDSSSTVDAEGYGFAFVSTRKNGAENVFISNTALTSAAGLAATDALTDHSVDSSQSFLSARTQNISKVDISLDGHYLSYARGTSTYIGGLDSSDQSYTFKLDQTIPNVISPHWSPTDGRLLLVGNNGMSGFYFRSTLVTVNPASLNYQPQILLQIISNTTPYNAAIWNTNPHLDESHVLFTWGTRGLYSSPAPNANRKTEFIEALSAEDQAKKISAIALSPDGLTMAFVVGNNNEHRTIYTCRLVGTVCAAEPLKPLLADYLGAFNANSGSPCWTADGKNILFDTDADGAREIYMIGSDGTGLVRLTHNPADDHSPACFK